MGLIDKKIVIVTGKGGVGKSTIAASIAYTAAQKGKKVLLVELGDESYYKSFLNLKSVNSVPSEAKDYGFQVALWDTESCLREYVLHYIKIDGLFKLFFENKVMRTFMNIAPALKELAILGKLTSGERNIGPEFRYDLVVLDGYATGHMLALLRAPKGMSETIKAGPMGVQSASIHRVLTDPNLTGYAIVTLPDELPTVEAIELQKIMKQEFEVEPQVILNRCLKIQLTDSEISELRTKVNETTGMGTFLRYIDSVLRRQRSSKEKLKSHHLEVHEVPLMFRQKTTKEIVSSISDLSVLR